MFGALEQCSMQGFIVTLAVTVTCTALYGLHSAYNAKQQTVLN